jgi:predicted protein tyrosine phosphatase
MSEIRVYSELELVELVEKGESLPDHLISIGNPRLPWKRIMPGERLPPSFRGKFKRILRLEFFDVDSLEHLGDMRPRRIPLLRDVKRVLRFYEATKAEASGYAVHCWGGISRSPAVALGLLYLETGSEEAAIRELRRIRPAAGPNRSIARYFDAALGSKLEEASQRIRDERMTELKAELEGMAGELLEELPPAE